MWFLFKILLVRGRNTCLCKGELCFILLRGVLASPCCFRSFFWLLVHWSYDHFYIHCYYLWYICVCVCVCVFFTYLYMCCFFSIFIRMFLYVRNPYFCFTHDALMSFVWVFQKDELWKSIMSRTLFLQSFSRVCSRDRFIL